MTGTRSVPEERLPAEGGRENVNVPNPSDEADPNPNRPGSDAGSPPPTKRLSDDDVASQPPRDEARDEAGEDNPHRSRRPSL